MSLSQKELIELDRILNRSKELENSNKLSLYFRDKDYITSDGSVIHSRFKYPKHLEFFRAGAHYKERGFIAANRVGKTKAGTYEIALHMTGLYPDWWPGKRFTKPNKGYVVGVTNEATRDVLQLELTGQIGNLGSGFIPKDLIVHTSPRPNVPNAISYLQVKHVSGGISEAFFRSSQQGRESFQGTAVDWALLDEEMPEDVYSEIIIRTMTTKGIIITTFTPLLGMSDIVMSYLPGGKFPSYDENLKYIATESTKDFNKFTINVTWDDVPHLSQEEKDLLWQATPPYLRAARAQGKPVCGVGRVYPIDEEDFLVDPFEIPDSWPKLYGLDVGWNRTAAIWGAINPNEGVTYLYSEYYRGQAEPSVHAHAVKARGDWIPGMIDPNARGRSQVDGQALLELYHELGLDVYKANNVVDTGVYTCFQRISSGRTKVFKTLSNFRQEFSLYQYDKNGKIYKKNDHLMDAWRYFEMGIDNAIAFSFNSENPFGTRNSPITSITGY
jgi:phage terminase large subunit-like protein